MDSRRVVGSRRWTAISAFVAVTAAAPALAQRPPDGFLLGAPEGQITLRGGWAAATAGRRAPGTATRPDIFGFVSRDLTLERGDFSSPALGIDLLGRLSSRLGLQFSADWMGTTRASEYRAFVGPDDEPITQRTQFQRVPVGIALRVDLRAPGRSIGRFAWIPHRFTPWVAAGGGGTWYRFRQTGEFIDFGRGDRIFRDTFASSGWAPMAQALGGIDVALTPRVALTLDGRAQWARATLTSDFENFPQIDLSGVTTHAGLTLRF
jgi:hypothetical protein